MLQPVLLLNIYQNVQHLGWIFFTQGNALWECIFHKEYLIRKYFKSRLLAAFWCQKFIYDALKCYPSKKRKKVLQLMLLCFIYIYIVILKFIFIKESWNKMHHGIRMISEGSSDTEDWTNDCWKFSFDITGINCILIYIKIEKCYFKL